MGLRGCGPSDTHIPDLVAVRPMRRCLRSQFRQGRGLVNHMAPVLGRFSWGIYVKCPAAAKTLTAEKKLVENARVSDEHQEYRSRNCVVHLRIRL
jgi:hypothetical protein